jgi:O-acetyl-ADP-ribose deacetylase (regulator of RNase III)/flagellin-specific chaperone FliS
MADQPPQALQNLYDRREKLVQEIESLEKSSYSSVQQVASKSADPNLGSDLDAVANLREQLADLDGQIDGLENADDSSDAAPPSWESLTQRHGTELAIARTGQPWQLPVNALVLPVGVQGGMQGGLSQALRSEFGESIWQDLRGQVQTAVSGITPESPVLVTLTDSLGPTILPNAPEMPDGTDNGRYQIIAATPALPDSDDLNPDAAASAIIDLAVKNNITHIAIPLLGSGRAGLESVATAEAMIRAIYWAIPDTDHPLKQVIMTTRPTDADDKSALVTAVQHMISILTANRTQRLSADSASGEDALGIEKEVAALAETLLLRDVETPLAVGVLGGWGSGKSFVMYLMLKEMMRIRSLPVRKGWDAGEEEPYVGHVYPIEFNAWTYAKSDLWASLMQTIFMELNKQLTMEQLIGEGLLKAGSYWLELSQFGEKEREALQSDVGQEAIDAAIKLWEHGEAPDSLWEAYNKVRATETTSMKATIAERNIKQATLEDLDNQLEIEKAEMIPEQAREQVWQEIITTAVFSTVAKEIQNDLKNKTYIDENNEVKHVFTEEDLEDLGKLSVKLKQFRPTVTEMWQEQTLWNWFKDQKWLLITAVILILATILMPYVAAAYNWLAQSETVTMITTFLAGISSVVIAFFRMYQPWIDKIQRWNDGISSVVNMADEMLTNKEQQMIAEREVTLEQRRRELEVDIENLNQQIDQHRQRLGIAAEFSSLYDFVSSRLAAGDYEKRLGMLHQTQADLKELTNTLMIHGKNDLFAKQKKDFFPRGPARVVLFVDDLDRCPPSKVVEVLEAVQLLLRTKLFVVVLGLDTRYVTRALEKEYVGILTRMGDPSGLDYIEKIIQIPYRVRPIEPNKLKPFLKAQMEMAEKTVKTEETEEKEDTKQSEGGEDTEEREDAGTLEGLGETDDGGMSEGIEGKVDKESDTETESETEHTEDSLKPEVIKFAQEDFEDLEYACQQIGLTPRSIKRLINVMKLIKVFWYRTKQIKKDREARTVINLLALSACYPEIMSQIFHNIEMAYHEEARNGDTLSSYLEEDLKNGDLIPKTQQVAFKTAVTNLKLDDITLKQFGLSTFHLVRSFSFVGDPTYDK